MHQSIQEHKSSFGRQSRLRDPLSGARTDKLALSVFVVLLVYSAVRSVVGAISKPFGYDELCTRIIALQPNIRAIWNALQRGADGQTFAFYIVERAASAVVPYDRIAFRIPSILAFCGTLICLFAFVRRRSGSTYALLCACIPVVTALFTTYAIEARAYSLLVLFIAIALVCYQQTSSTKWVFLMAISLAAAEAMHYYAVFAMMPFVAAEASVVLLSRRVRMGVWLALLCGALPLAGYWKVL
jgi:hypothetical protein